MGSVCVCVHLAVNKRSTLALFSSQYNVAGWHTRQRIFVVLTGQRGAAWQCLTLRRFRAGDRHHEAQQATELRPEGVCVSQYVLWSQLDSDLQMFCISHTWCLHGAAEMPVHNSCSKKVTTSSDEQLDNKVSFNPKCYSRTVTSFVDITETKTTIVYLY